MILTQTWVPGHPKTKGSLTAKGGYATDTPASKRWRALMAERVRADIARRGAHEDVYPYAGPVLVAAYFWIDPPGTSYTRDTGAGTAATWHGAGDVDKLARNLLDALAADARSAIMNGGAIMNDNQVINLNVWKFAVDRSAGRAPGVWLSVATLPASQSLERIEASSWGCVARQSAAII